VDRNDSQLDPFVQSVAAAIDAGGLIPPRATVVVGVSGGADSVALLAALRELSGQAGREYTLIVAHLNHGLRAQAEQDEHFVAELAERWRLPYEVHRCDVADESRRLGQGVEQAGRRLRYDFLLQVAHRHRAACVAVGHHADDQVETVLFRLFRGCHLRGLGGMAAIRPLDGGVSLVRPLLTIRRAEVEAYCRRLGLTWREDASNADTAFRRNFIRNELLPLLRDRLNPQVDQAVESLAAAAAEAEGHLRRLGEAALARAEKAEKKSAGPSKAQTILDLSALQAEAPLIRRYAIRIAMERAGVPMRAVTAEHFHQLQAMAGEGKPAAMDLPNGWLARIEGGAMVLAGPSAVGKPDGGASWLAVELACPGRTVLPDGRAIVCERSALDRQAFEVHCRSGRHDVEWLDADAVQGAMVCHPRQRGDAFWPLGCDGRRKVGKLLTDLKLPRAVRRFVLCVQDQAGIVLCLPVRIDDRVKITDSTRNILRIGVVDADGSAG
jgi:tRNA(Ile)-lysidine synthase